MSWQVYARFKQQDGHEFRVEADLRYGAQAKHFIGSVLMINPGSSHHLLKNHEGLSLASKDFTFRVIISVVELAYKKAGKDIPQNSYIQILNLFDLRESNLSLAMNKFVSLKDKKELDDLLFASLKKMDIKSPWIWIGWGSEERHPDLKRQMIDLVKQIPPQKIIGYKYPGQEVGYYHPKYIQLHPPLRGVVVAQIVDRIKS